uniref:SCAN box domain-containing protein n=1 Tax=Leptobrachium leishanense TaxID=445787 RepID=A0A8C5Q5A8_9ANUR
MKQWKPDWLYPQCLCLTNGGSGGIISTCYTFAKALKGTESTEKMEEVLKALVHATQCESNHLLQAQIEAVTQAQKADREVLHEALQHLSRQAPPDQQIRVRASCYLQKMLPEDNVEAYLHAFERTATRESWPADTWAGIIAPFLIGEAQKAYYDLDDVHAADYKLLKAKILARFGVTETVRAQRFCNWGFEEKIPPRTQIFDLIHFARKWLQPELNKPVRIVEIMVLNKFLRGLPRSLREWVGQGNPTNYDDMVAQVECYMAAKHFEDAPRKAPRVFAGSLPSYKKGHCPKTLWVPNSVAGDLQASQNLRNVCAARRHRSFKTEYASKSLHTVL